MNKSFEVGAVFRIIDEASPALRKLLAQIRALNKAVKDTQANISSMMKSMGVSMEPAIAETRALAGEWKAVSAAAQGARRSITSAARASAIPAEATAASSMLANGRPRIAGGGRGGRGGGRGGHGFVTEGIGVPMPGGLRGSFRAGHSGAGTAGMIGAGALAYGIYEEAKLKDAIFLMKWHAGLPNTPENDKYFRDLIQSTASKTGYDYKDIAEAATDEIRLLKGAEGKESGGLGVLPEMLRAAATEAKVKPGTNLQGAMRSLVEQAHMAQEYGIEQIKGMAPLLAFLSTTNPATMPQMVRAASYAMPTLHSALAMDPADILYQTTAIARAGATNTKSGTWVRAAFERALPPDPRVVGDKEYARRMFAMREVGLVNAKGKSTVLDPTGTHLDIDKLLDIVNKATKNLPLVERNAFMKKTFGEQGERGMFLMMSPAVVAQTKELKREFPEFKQRYGTFMEDYNQESPIQKFRTTWQDMTGVLADIGSTVLPPVTAALHDFDAALKLIKGSLPKGSGDKDSAWGKVGGSALLGFGIGAGVGAFTGPGALAVGTVTGLVSGALTAAEIYSTSVTKTGSAANAAAPAVSGLSSAIESLMGAARSFMNFGTQSLHPGSVPPPPPAAGGGEKHSSIYMDGRKVGQIVSRHQSVAANGPLQGSAYHDGSGSSAPGDFNHAWG